MPLAIRPTGPGLVVSFPRHFAVPWGAPRFAGDFELTSQADKQQIYEQMHGGAVRLLVLNLSQSVDDTAWATGNGHSFALWARGGHPGCCRVDHARGALRRRGEIRRRAPGDSCDT